MEKILQTLSAELKQPVRVFETEEERAKIGDFLKKWGDDFKNTFGNIHVTPYVHVIATHVPLFIQKYGSLDLFSQQGFEATHKWHNTIYSRASSRDGAVSKSKVQQNHHTARPRSLSPVHFVEKGTNSLGCRLMSCLSVP